MQVAFENHVFDFEVIGDAGTRIAEIAQNLGADAVAVVCDETVYRQHGERILGHLRRARPTKVIEVHGGEKIKSFSGLAHVCDEALRSGITRRSIIVALGGGAVGNLAGLASGLLFRGIRLIHIPTTVMAAFDSVLSLKQAINHSGAKNVVGMYHVPSAVVVDTKSFDTLPDRELASGLYETVKNALAIDPDTMDEVCRLIDPDNRRSEPSFRRVMELSIGAKMKVMANDAYEKKGALVLEYGHTVAHALESIDLHAQPSDGIRHGEAVALGMIVAAFVSKRLGHSGDEMMSQTLRLLAAARQPSKWPAGIGTDDVIRSVKMDNKRGMISCSDDEVAMVLLRSPGNPVWTGHLPLTKVPFSVLEQALIDTKGMRVG